ncbi:MAG TPA: cobalamin-binding protein [Anaerolineae bacterium]|nr:cobalamin-binding protein [Anaerolineae bacterium]
MHKIYRLLIIAVTLMITTACGPAPTQPPSPPTAQSPNELAAFPLTLTDDLGRKVTVETRPQRIVSLAPSNTEILFAVGAGEQVVGVTTYCNYPPEAQTREQIGGFSAETISVEKIIALKPDLVLSAGKLHETVIEALEQAGITVYAVDAETFDQVYATIEVVGQMTGHDKEATNLVAQMKERVAAVESVVAEIPNEERPTVFWETWDDPLMTAGPTTFAGQMIEKGGGVNLFADVTERYPQISAEEVIKRNPDVIMGPDSHGEALTADQVATRPGWETVKAVQDGRIYVFDGDITSRAGPRIVDGLEMIARALHPDRFPK